MKKKIKVLQEHIDNGIHSSGYSCPIALALKNYVHQPDVDLSTIGYKINTTDIKYVDVPRSAQRFIKRFDSGKEVKPFTFLLEVE